MSGTIRFEGVELWRRTQAEFSYDFKRTVFSALARRLRAPARQRILHDLTFTIARGEKLGVIGPNGSGKSTVLKLICGILEPTRGLVEVSGTIAPLIELGAGFEPELSVADNVVYYGMLLGFDRAFVGSRIGAVLAFAELEEYRDVPLKALSSGMAARLGFAIATEVRPEIILLDEVFAVGDESFRHRSATRMREMWHDRATIVVVSHDLPFIASECERAMWLENGELRALGAARPVVDSYIDAVRKHETPDGRFRLSPDHAIGTLEEAACENGILSVRGWAVATAATHTGSRVAILVDGAYLDDASYGDVRPDVAASLFRDAIARCGFRGGVPLLDRFAPGHHLVSCALFDPQTSLHHPFGEAVAIEISAR